MAIIEQIIYKLKKYYFDHKSYRKKKIKSKQKKTKTFSKQIVSKLKKIFFE